jgi:hypothetical protein
MKRHGVSVIVLLALLVCPPFPGSAAAPSTGVAGTWEVNVQYVLGTGNHRMTIEQAGGNLTGTYTSQQGTTVPLEGTFRENAVEIRVRMRHEGSRSTYTYHGQVTGNTMRGSVDLGEYWSAQWTAKRVE